MFGIISRRYRFVESCLKSFSSVKNVRLISLSNALSNTSSQESSHNTNSRDPEKVKRAKLLDVLIISSIGIIGFGYLMVRRTFGNQVHAKSEEDANFDEVCINNENKLEVVEAGAVFDNTRNKRKSFKETRIIGYEDRIRAYSTPDKIFRYFATIQSGHLGTEKSEIYMTPQDFVRALTPGILQPQGLGLDRFKQFDKEKDAYRGYTYRDGTPGDSVLRHFGQNGLITFSDYLFLLTVLGTSPRHVSIAFKMFDLNGDGEVSADEFDKMQSVLLSLTSAGMRHRDRKTTGNVMGSKINSSLKQYFFGSQCTEKLTTRSFIEFQQRLQKEVLFLEFQFYKPVNGKITEVEFANMLLTYSSFTTKKKETTLKRIKKTFARSSQGVTFKDYEDFFQFLRNIGDVETALSFHTACGYHLNPEIFKRVAHLVAGVRLRDHIIDVVFKMFDENDDGELSSKEFVSVMKTNLMRGLDKPRDTGFGKLVSAVAQCAKQTAKDQIFGK
ncbi:calcium uptake protein 1, mitochondrial-like [Xenia sp. Carnegie-2017]|uniref:calcium uptake protein 1, mitochondrial-like n=1 Tax=Xenia sp. Carnegie-2017 TaxID=2897299 RepID=UPI001F048D36|nr:calcium uptake protein 1, mitochondrial-like [Xenia sp. Carnegie-2017]